MAIDKLEFERVVNAIVKPIINKHKDDENTKLRYMEFHARSGSTGMLKLSGGLNGHGKWSDYFSTLSEFMADIENSGLCVYLENIGVDACDDVFYPEFHISELKNRDIKNPYVFPSVVKD